MNDDDFIIEPADGIPRRDWDFSELEGRSIQHLIAARDWELARSSGRLCRAILRWRDEYPGWDDPQKVEWLIMATPGGPGYDAATGEEGDADPASVLWGGWGNVGDPWLIAISPEFPEKPFTTVPEKTITQRIRAHGGESLYDDPTTPSGSHIIGRHAEGRVVTMPKGDPATIKIPDHWTEAQFIANARELFRAHRAQHPQQGDPNQGAGGLKRRLKTDLKQLAAWRWTRHDCENPIERGMVLTMAEDGTPLYGSREQWLKAAREFSGRFSKIIS